MALNIFQQEARDIRNYLDRCATAHAKGQTMLLSLTLFTRVSLVAAISSNMDSPKSKCAIGRKP